MGKDKHGTYVPKKGKPSGAGKEEGLGFRPTMPPEEVEQDLKMTEKYTTGPDELADNVYMRHPNRNTEKEYDYKRERDENPSAKSVNDTFDKEHHPATEAEELPGVIDKAVFNDLASYKGDIAISIYMPAHKKGEAVNKHEDLIRFKNTIQQAKQMLEDKNTEETTIQTLLQPAYDLIRNEDFWLDQNKGFAAFISDGTLKYAKLPVEVDEEVYINTSFLLSPLLTSMFKEDRFYILVLSKKNVKLYKADAFEIEEVKVPELPNGMDDVVHFEEKDGQNVFRAAGGGVGKANFHGIGSGEPDEKKNISMYFDEVDETLMKHVLGTENAPLLLAAVDYLIPLYKAVAKYNYIADEYLTGNYEHEDVNALFKTAKEKMQSYFERHVQKELNNYYNNSATNLTSTDAKEIIPGSFYARVAHLFVQKGARIWGTFDKNDNQLELHSERQNNDENLLDKAVIKTILNGGEVHLLEKEKMPNGSEIAAFFRY
ncbi:MAG: baeRF7 domain-containing protein [Ilyomonas sp.]